MQQGNIYIVMTACMHTRICNVCMLTDLEICMHGAWCYCQAIDLKEATVCMLTFFWSLSTLLQFGVIIILRYRVMKVQNISFCSCPHSHRRSTSVCKE